MGIMDSAIWLLLYAPRYESNQSASFSLNMYFKTVKKVVSDFITLSSTEFPMLQ